MTACNQPGCGGTIEPDGYCSLCGLAPAPAAVPAAGEQGSGSGAAGSSVSVPVPHWLGPDGRIQDPAVTSFEPGCDGVVLLCSDGLWNYLPEPAGLAALALPAALTDPVAAAGRLVAFALGAGGADNITAVLARFQRAPASDPRSTPA